MMRLAFGTFLGLPDPMAFMPSANFVGTRWRAFPDRVFAAEVEGRLAGSNIAVRWGSVGFFGPLSVHPKYWDAGVGKRLMEPIMDCFAQWNVSHAGLFTFAQSPKHAGLYERFGFWPRFLTRIMAKEIDTLATPLPAGRVFSQVAVEDRPRVLECCRKLTSSIYDGLDVGSEIMAVENQNLGDTVLLGNDDGISGFAVCHCGHGTEAGVDTCYIKFGAARSAEEFAGLIQEVETMAASRKLKTVMAGSNTARREACKILGARSYRTIIQGVLMQRNNEAAYNREGVFVIDDWR
ncbi:GNAT family N-acetyltransferase [Candidatus Sumerlaeota bacterium]|nr:GNAT family N-acetyltransferase [Candidatus Sumerlaeota bacterium]